MSLTKEGGLLVVVREVDKIWPTLPAVERARIVQYRGFDSRASWPDLELSAIPIEVVNNVADLSQYQAVREYVGIIQGRVREKVDLLLLRDIENKSICELSNTFTFIGYDVGVLNEFDEPVFSSIILHEIHKSGNSLVRDLHQSLNKFYLLRKSAIKQLFSQS